MTGARPASSEIEPARGPRPRRPFFDRFASSVTRAVGTSTAFTIAFGGVLLWGLLGPMMDYSQEWQMVINTITTVITFLMVFVIQQSQNRDSIALHLKLDELIATTSSANNLVLRAEQFDEAELFRLRDLYCRMAEEAERRRPNAKGSVFSDTVASELGDTAGKS
jgi:low affinity Fe/Cu permease